MKRKIKIKNILQPSDCILISPRKKKFIQKGISYFTDSPWTHIAMYVGNGEIIHNTIGGKQKSPLRWYMNPKRHRLCIREIRGINASVKQQIITEAYKRVGKTKYGYKSYLGFIIFHYLRIPYLKNPYMEADSQVCSTQYAVDIYRGSNILLCDKTITQITPEDLYQSNKMRTKYEEI